MCGQIRNKSKTGRGRGRLSSDEVRAIRKAKKDFYDNMPKNLCKKYGVSRYVVSQIWQGITYNHVI